VSRHRSRGAYIAAGVGILGRAEGSQHHGGRDSRRDFAIRRRFVDGTVTTSGGLADLENCRDDIADPGTSLQAANARETRPRPPVALALAYRLISGRNVRKRAGLVDRCAASVVHAEFGPGIGSIRQYCVAIHPRP
jgi:hypothetical protein